MTVQLTNEPDKFSWALTNSGIFMVRSLYLYLMSGHTVFLRKYIWKMKVPLKIRIFMWFLFREVFLMKDNLARRNWHDCNKCCFCDQDETIQHLFITCPLAKMAWRIVFLAFNISPPTSISNMF